MAPCWITFGVAAVAILFAQFKVVPVFVEVFLDFGIPFERWGWRLLPGRLGLGALPVLAGIAWWVGSRPTWRRTYLAGVILFLLVWGGWMVVALFAPFVGIGEVVG